MPDLGAAPPVHWDGSELLGCLTMNAEEAIMYFRAVLALHGDTER